ncbi:MAG: hypothetical protein QMD95_01090 [Candidatus Hodarchaeaceae archaeon]|nr:hypothetical protein [Candidatus Hodarchaeaceae archaeon]
MGALKIVGVFILSVALLSAAMFVISRPPQEGEGVEGEKSALPAWSPGNQWSYKSSAGTTYSYTMTQEENWGGIPSYRLDGTVNPPFGGWGPNVRRLYEKATLGLRTEIFYDSAQSQTTQYTRSYSTSPWPLEVGKSYTEDVTIERSYVQGPEGWSDPVRYQTLYVTIEAVESVTVEAGTFESYKLVARSADNNLVEARWYSSTAKNFVKIVNQQTGETLELSSYQI